MLLIYCPYCEEDRSELEFRHGGDAHIVRPTNMADISDEEFEEFFFLRDNPKGVIYERWRHIHGCGRFFNAARDTVSDRFLASYKTGEPKPALSGASPASAQLAEPPAQIDETTEGTAK
ncbi:sarcosine oxidase subunit delta [Shinella daejeonensis]|uniref:sarcosine oxidase subunit delta family protein n=1 Tax=Shinella daejeonensis TaxID=659017 RepID=UPI0020C7E350|nr:sarcosine oxidase subunit delta [Shinella daejeonensis]MCP8896123.1 sarcosine oxidase subunit delta [Shinella daejeonensis]